MKISGLQKTSLIEYSDKLSCIVFTQGCNLRCPFCHNPELVLPEKFLPLIDTADIFNFLKQRKEYLEGVVITGGEPCLQKELYGFAEKIRDEGFCVKIETNGTMPECIEKLIKGKVVDCISMDIKGPFRKYDKLCGTKVDTKKIEQSISIVMGAGIQYEFKTTVVLPLLEKNDFHEIAEHIKGAELHYLQRFVPSETVGDKCENLQTATEQDFQDLRAIMSKQVKNCIIR